jgi:hypothetical protein
LVCIRSEIGYIVVLITPLNVTPKVVPALTVLATKRPPVVYIDTDVELIQSVVFAVERRPIVSCPLATLKIPMKITVVIFTAAILVMFKVVQSHSKSSLIVANVEMPETPKLESIYADLEVERPPIDCNVFIALIAKLVVGLVEYMVLIPVFEREILAGVNDA